MQPSSPGLNDGLSERVGACGNAPTGEDVSTHPPPDFRERGWLSLVLTYAPAAIPPHTPSAMMGSKQTNQATPQTAATSPSKDSATKGARPDLLASPVLHGLKLGCKRKGSEQNGASRLAVSMYMSKARVHF